MTQKGLLVLTIAALLSIFESRATLGDVRREQTARRPYIVEIGQPYAINAHRLQYEIEHISELNEYVTNYGYPDYAEIQDTSPEWPWEAYEVRLYYLQPNRETDFSPVILSPAAPNFGVLRFRGEITPEKRHEVELVLQAREKPAVSPPVTAAPPVAEAPPPAVAAPAPEPAAHGLTEALVARIEAAAERSAQAADRAAAESDAAVRSADRTTSIVEKLETRAATQR
ncbi:MAG: hypothetical protein ACHQ9S_11955 [Candidatus Binatia bacterium]